MANGIWTREQVKILRRRYPAEGASPDLCRAIGLQSWQLRRKASSLGIKIEQEVVRGKQGRYNGRSR